MRRTGLWVGAVAIGCWAGADLAAPITVTLTSSKDNTLIESATGSLSNAKGALFVGRTNQPAGQSIRRALMAFDFSSIPAGATVSSATLTLVVGQTHGLAQSMSLFRVTQDWGEGTSSGSGSGGLATTGDATWLHTFFNTKTWNSPGGDFVATPSATTAVSGFGNETWTSAQMASDIQAWAASPSTNFGWVLVGNETTNLTAYEFGSRESGGALAPSLSVTYEAAVPEPGALALVAIAAPLLARRRRRQLRVA
jgi:hypothetical protein